MYAEKPEEAIEREFLTEVVPLPYEGWYYYVSDYNAGEVEEGPQRRC